LVPADRLAEVVRAELAAGRTLAVWSVDAALAESLAGVGSRGGGDRGAHAQPLTWRARPASVSAMERELYRALRELDALKADLIVVEAPPAAADWFAINDRLLRAAAR
jgi:L-threonylcarbamoyladenylate synthase